MNYTFNASLLNKNTDIKTVNLTVTFVSIQMLHIKMLNPEHLHIYKIHVILIKFGVIIV